MLLHFRQGIVEAQIPVFFRVTYPSVDLIVTDTNTTVAFAAGSKDYLYTEQVSVANAWGPLHLGIDQWLYWDLDNRTGYRTFGITIVEPIVASTMPSSPLMDQHWFDTSTNEMKVWTGNVWSKKIRAFACKLAQGRVPVSMSANSPSFIGTQVGNTSDTYAGHILYDATTNNAIKNANGQFVTTEDKLSTKTISLSQVKVASIIVEGEAQQNMAAHTIVVFSEFGKIVHADQFVAEQPIQFGIIESSATVGQTVNVVTSGMVTSQAFDFSALGVNALLYCSATGQLVSSPIVPNQTPVAVVVDRKTIQLGVALASSTDTIPVVNLATDTVYGISRLSVPAEDAADPIVVGDNDPRFDGYINRAGDNMEGPLYLSGAPTQDLHAATKKYVDDSRTPAAGSTTQIQYNTNGQFAASDELTIGIPTAAADPTTITVGGPSHQGAVVTTSSSTGDLSIVANTVTVAGNANTGSVHIDTNGTSRVVYDATGAWLVGGQQSAGAAGQVLTSNGPGAEPIWGNVSNGTGLADRIIDNNTIVRAYDTVQDGAKVTTSINNQLIVDTTATRTLFVDHTPAYWQTSIEYVPTGTWLSSWNRGPVLDSFGNSYTVVYDDNSFNYNYLTKTDPNGIELWSMYFDTGTSYAIENVTTDGTNSYVVLTWGADTSKLHKIGPNGEILWSVEVGNFTTGMWNQTIRCLLLSSDGTTLYAAGTSSAGAPTIYELSTTTGVLLGQRDISVPSGYTSGAVTGIVYRDDGTISIMGEIWHNAQALNEQTFVANISDTFVVNWMKVGLNDHTTGNQYVRYLSQLTCVGQYTVVVGSMTHYMTTTATTGYIVVLDSVGTIIHDLDVASVVPLMGSYDITLRAVAADPSTPNTCIVAGAFSGVTPNEQSITASYYVAFDVITGTLYNQYNVSYSTTFAPSVVGISSHTERPFSIVVTSDAVLATVQVRDTYRVPPSNSTVYNDKPCTYRVPKFSNITLSELSITQATAMVQTGPTSLPVDLQLVPFASTSSLVSYDTYTSYDATTNYGWNPNPAPLISHLPAARTASASGYNVEIQGAVVPKQIRVAGSTGQFNSVIWHDGVGPSWVPDYMSTVYNLRSHTFTWNPGSPNVGTTAVLVDPRNGFHQYDPQRIPNNLASARWLFFTKGLDTRRLWRVRIELDVGTSPSLWIGNLDNANDNAYGMVYWMSGDSGITDILNGASDGISLFEFYTRDGGETWYGVRLRGTPPPIA